MIFLFLVIGGLSIGFVTHVAVWRIRLPKKQTRALLINFIAVFATIVMILTIKTELNPFRNLLTAFNWIDYVHASAMYFAAVLTYIIFYTAIEGTSPSFLILLALRAAQAKGKSREELIRLLAKDNLLMDKLRGLLDSGKITESNETYVITRSGRNLIHIFTFYRKLLNVPEGKG